MEFGCVGAQKGVRVMRFKVEESGNGSAFGFKVDCRKGAKISLSGSYLLFKVQGNTIAFNGVPNTSITNATLDQHLKKDVWHELALNNVLSMGYGKAYLKLRVIALSDTNPAIDVSEMFANLEVAPVDPTGFDLD